jgi:hypothetical protein
MESNNTNRTGLIGIIVLLLLIVIGAATYLYYNKAEAPVQPEEENTVASLASSCGITVDSPTPGSAVSFPVTITGRVDNTNAEAAGCRWVMFEGQAGVATLSYETKDGWSLPVDMKPIPVEDWMTTQTTFSVTLNFDNTTQQLPAGYNFRITLTEDDPSGMGQADVVEIPVVLQ